MKCRHNLDILSCHGKKVIRCIPFKHYKKFDVCYKKGITRSFARSDYWELIKVKLHGRVNLLYYFTSPQL
jgi:hypothetical protein